MVSTVELFGTVGDGGGGEYSCVPGFKLNGETKLFHRSSKKFARAAGALKTIEVKMPIPMPISPAMRIFLLSGWFIVCLQITNQYEYTNKLNLYICMSFVFRSPTVIF